MPRSVSEFDLSITSDVPLLHTRLTPISAPKPKAAPKNREKMVTFEDEMSAGRKNPLEDVFM